MFERFTERARRVVVLAQEEARMLDHNYIGTEHILLGLIHEGDGVAARVIGSMGLTLGAARDQVAQMIGRGSAVPSGHIPFTPRAKKVLELSLREALELNNTYIGTEHILLGLIREGHGVGAQILERVAGPLPTVREAVIALASNEPREPDADEPMASARTAYATPSWVPGERTGDAERGIRVRPEMVMGYRRTLESIERRLAAIERHLGIDSNAEIDGEQDEAQDEAAVRKDPPLT
jgi:ATP-dependent Clp protease ATP-binding subunit ClpC